MTRRSLLVDLELPEVDEARPRADLEVARHPGDLDAHERRLAEASTPEGVYGALVDLFIGSTPADQAVRVAALAAHGDQLTDEQHDALRVAAARGLDPASPVPPARRSLLTSGATSAAPLVVATDRSAVAPPAAVAAPAAVAPTAAAAAARPVADASAAPRDGVPAEGPTSASAAAPSPAPTPTPTAPQPVRPVGTERPRRNAGVLVAAAIVVVLLVVAGLVLRSRSETTTAAVTGPSVTVTSVSVPTPSTTPAPTTAAPTTVAPSTVAPTTASPTTAAPSTGGPGPAATAGVAALFSALARPSAAWPSDVFTGDSATAATIEQFRRELVTADAALVTDVTQVDAVSTSAGADAATVTVEVTHRGAVLQRPDGAVTWAAPGRTRYTVDLVRRNGVWLVTTITRVP